MSAIDDALAEIGVTLAECGEALRGWEFTPDNEGARRRQQHVLLLLIEFCRRNNELSSALSNHGLTRIDFAAALEQHAAEWPLDDQYLLRLVAATIVLSEAAGALEREPE